MELNRNWFKALWIVLLVLHVFYALTYGLTAYLYGELISRADYYSTGFRYFGLDTHLRTEISITMIITSALVMMWHIYAAIRMVVVSIQAGQVIFGPESIKRNRAVRRVTTWKTYRSIYMRWLCRLHWLTMSVDGTYFENISDMSESVEIITQIYLTFRMSCYISYSWLNHFSVIALVANCWSTPYLRYRYQHTREGRFIRVVTEALLAACFTVAIPLCVLILWMNICPKVDFYNNVWVINTASVSQQLAINTWPNALSTQLAAAMASASIETVKHKAKIRNDVMQNGFGKISAPQQNIVPKSRMKMIPKRINRVIPITARSGDSTHTAELRSFELDDQTITRSGSYYLRCLYQNLINIFFFMTGAVVLGIHLYAYMRPWSTRWNPNLHCRLHMSPWWSSSLTPCAVLEVNCYRLGIQGNQGELDEILKEVDPKILASLLFSHCPALTMPPTIQTFANLVQLEIFNSTLIRWGEEAAVTKRNNPRLSEVYVALVKNMVSLPPGLLADDFPACDIEFCATDLADLPADLDKIWTQRIDFFTVQQTHLTHVPEALTRMNLTTVTLSDNAITSIPVEFLDGRRYSSLTLNNNSIALLPSVTNSNTPCRLLFIMDTDISILPPWAEAVTTIFAAGTPLCNNLESNGNKNVVCDASDPRLADPTVNQVFPLERLLKERLP